MIRVEPAPTPVAVRVLASKLATLTSVEAHAAEADTSPTESSENVPVAWKASDVPMPSVALVGVTAMDSSVADVTVSAALPLCPAALAPMLTIPGATPVATPAETVATDVSEELHVAVAVTSWVEPSESVTTALNAALPLMPTLPVAGVTPSETTVALGTVIIDLPVLPASVAEMVALPAAIALTLPATTLATFGALLDQKALAETSSVEPSA
jgi:hypothetical protein